MKRGGARTVFKITNGVIRREENPGDFELEDGRRWLPDFEVLQKGDPIQKLS